MPNWFGRLYLWATHRLYNELAWAYDLAAWLVSFGQWSGWRAQALDYVVGDRILELGFGTGELLLEMARRDLLGYGLDPSPAMQRLTTGKMSRRGLARPRVRAIAQAIPFADSSFDSLVATFPAEYIVAPETLAEVRRVLRPGGRLVVLGLYTQVHNPFLQRLFRLLFGTPQEPLPTAYSRLADAAGFRVQEVPLAGRGLSPPILIMSPKPQGR
jgi:ubiquinone/menaquinone biosynthesis C-methylase UbiE